MLKNINRTTIPIIWMKVEFRAMGNFVYCTNTEFSRVTNQLLKIFYRQCQGSGLNNQPCPVSVLVMSLTYTPSGSSTSNSLFSRFCAVGIVLRICCRLEIRPLLWLHLIGSHKFFDNVVMQFSLFFHKKRLTPMLFTVSGNSLLSHSFFNTHLYSRRPDAVKCRYIVTFQPTWIGAFLFCPAK